MTRPPETHFIPRDRAAFLRRTAKSPVVGLWRWEVVDETGAWMRDDALVRFGNGRSWIGELEEDSFSALRRSLGYGGAHPTPEKAAHRVQRVPRPTLLNAYLLLILIMLGGVIRMVLFDGEPEFGLLLAVGVPVGFLWAIALRAMGSWRSRLQVGEGRLQVFEGRGKEATHDLALADLGDLWLRELHPVQQRTFRHRGTANTLHLVARTRDGREHLLLCLRSGVLTCRNRNAVLGWLERIPGRNGVASSRG